MGCRVPKVSIIISCYNHEKYIVQSINSVLNQTYTDYEILIINDGSTDNSSNIINRIVDKNKDKITFIDHSVNQRPRFASNLGLSLAKGQYIAWNDGDDIWYPEKLEKQMYIFQQDNKKKIGLVYCYGKNLNENPNRMRSEVEAVDVKDDVFEQLFNSAFFFKISIVARKEVYDFVGIMDERYPYCADYELLLRIAAAGYQFDRVPEVLVGHRIHDTNETQNRAVAQQNTKEMLANIASNYKSLIKSKNINVSKRLAVCDLLSSEYYFANGNKTEARKILYKILMEHPLMILTRKKNIILFLLTHISDNIIINLRKLHRFNKLFISNINI